MTKGGCLCGMITYEVSGALRPVIACHCRQCRKTSGHHVAATATQRENLSIQGNLKWFNSSERAKRGFCPTCGSNLFWDGGGERISIFAGTLDDPVDLALVTHIYCADKGDYYNITDDLPKANKWDSSLSEI